HKGDSDAALADYDAALRVNPNDVETLCGRSFVHFLRGAYAKAVADSDAALERDPNHVKSLVYRAWIRATCLEEAYRDGKQAVSDAQKAVRLTEGKDAGSLHTLAAAEAECGQFDEAVKWEQQAVDLVAEGRKAHYLSFLRWYQAGKPFRQKPR